MQELIIFLTRHWELSYSLLAIIILLGIVEFLRAKRNTFQIGARQATQLINHDNAVVIDLRTPEAFKKGHIVDALSLPASELKNTTKKLEKHKTKPLILVDNTGVESQKIAFVLQKQGYKTHLLTGGMRAWQGADMPVVRGA